MPEPITGRALSAFALGFPMRDTTAARFGLDELAALCASRGRSWALRELAARAGRAPSPPSPPWRPGELIALALLGDVHRAVIDYYCVDEHAGALDEALTWLDAGAPGAPFAATVAAFEASYPQADGLDREAAGRELVALSVLTDNPATAAYRELFDDAPLRAATPYAAAIASLEGWFDARPPVDDLALPLFAVLRAPSKAHPTSLRAQLTWVAEHLAHILPAWLLGQLEVVSGVLAEEEHPRGHGPGPLAPLTFGAASAAAAYERFTPDRDWMANVVLLAKSTYVWLDQLTREYGQPIARLDEIPDAELDRMAARGFTSLWLIGVWERSTASRTIKQWRGNPEALASAYSLYDYVVAQDLGGDEAWWQLDGRCRARGIRLATDMVPNHTGLDSRWIVDHPDWFLQLPHAPFPGYRFTSADLCPDPAVSVHIEDGYWDHSDAAVVFKLYDHRDGRERYIYHGNDGTSMPWNDTAQIDYLHAEAREAVMQKILHVARMSSVIRFDAAMTLAREHVQRLWYPLPGHGGAIPSRAERSLTQAEFDAAMPHEFWREVVDRVQAEVPDTLLLAEAFWLMEGYFVRTLGMHRVYNSAFMHMLRDEDNANYRLTLKNVLAFSAEVLKRFVNFMNNPDEETAAEQFGHGDKYFGVATLLVTLPGLPMFGHGQVEGLSEKYGMEYRRAYRDERTDAGLVARHVHDIFPLLRLRHVFSQVDHFALYDLWTGDGHVNEDVFAYSNRAGDARALVCYHNAYRDAAGWILGAVPTRRGGSDAPLVQPTLPEALALPADAGVVCLRELRRGLWYLRDSAELAARGLFVQLGAYETLVFLEIHTRPASGGWGDLCRWLDGRGVPDLDKALTHMRFETERAAFARLVDDDPAAPADVATVLALDSPATPDPSPVVAALERLAVMTVPAGSRSRARALVVLAALGPAAREEADLYDLAALHTGEPDDAVLLELLLRPDLTFSTLVREAAGYLRVNTHDGVRWFRGEAMDALLAGWALLGQIANTTDEAPTQATYEPLRAAVADAEFRYDALLEALASA